MNILFAYIVLQIACSVAPTEPAIGEGPLTGSSEWSDERVLRELEYSVETGHSRRVGPIMVMMKDEQFLRLEPDLFRLFKEAPPAPELFIFYSPEWTLQADRSNRTFRSQLRFALMSHPQNLQIIERFMLDQGLTYTHCHQLYYSELAQHPTFDADSSDNHFHSDALVTCEVIVWHQKSCMTGEIHEALTPVTREQVRDEPGCQTLRNTIERDFSHWDATRIRLRSEQNVPAEDTP